MVGDKKRYAIDGRRWLVTLSAQDKYTANQKKMKSSVVFCVIPRNCSAESFCYARLF